MCFSISFYSKGPLGLHSMSPAHLRHSSKPAAHCAFKPFHFVILGFVTEHDLLNILSLSAELTCPPHPSVQACDTPGLYLPSPPHRLDLSESCSGICHETFTLLFKHCWFHTATRFRKNMDKEIFETTFSYNPWMITSMSRASFSNQSSHVRRWR